VVVGGIVPNNDLADLEAAGVAAVFGPGAGADHIVATINSLVAPSL
jgi:methylmalonyl-CoA mutase cobalamin-binding domain/chain